MVFFSLAVFLLSLVVSLSGCAGHTSHPDEAPGGQTVRVGNASTPSTSTSVKSHDLDKLALLWKSRSSDAQIADYPVGPGDLLEISVPAMEELKINTVRVSNEGTISLPFIGAMPVGGLTEQEIKQEIARRLEKDYMHNPQVGVRVQEYHARQVAITGAVAKPGLYSLTTGVETLLDAISLAGGTTKEAAPRILFIAAESVKNPTGGGGFPVIPTEAAATSSILQRVDPIVIDVNRLAAENGQMYLTLPVRPGDVIIVPSSGEVLVEGWVEKPGSYKITPGLTLLGAVAAAGGSAFAADAGAVTLMRTNEKGQKIFYSADLEKIKRGEEPDVAVQEGDIIEVPSSSPRLVAYGLYRFLSTVMNIGASVPLAK